MRITDIIKEILSATEVSLENGLQYVEKTNLNEKTKNKIIFELFAAQIYQVTTHEPIDANELASVVLLIRKSKIEENEKKQLCTQIFVDGESFYESKNLLKRLSVLLKSGTLSQGSFELDAVETRINLVRKEVDLQHTHPINVVRFSKDGNFLISADNTGKFVVRYRSGEKFFKKFEFLVEDAKDVLDLTLRKISNEEFKLNILCREKYFIVITDASELDKIRNVYNHEFNQVLRTHFEWNNKLFCVTHGGIYEVHLEEIKIVYTFESSFIIESVLVEDFEDRVCIRCFYIGNVLEIMIDKETKIKSSEKHFHVEEIKIQTKQGNRFEANFVSHLHYVFLTSPVQSVIKHPKGFIAQVHFDGMYLFDNKGYCVQKFQGIRSLNSYIVPEVVDSEQMLIVSDELGNISVFDMITSAFNVRPRLNVDLHSCGAASISSALIGDKVLVATGGSDCVIWLSEISTRKEDGQVDYTERLNQHATIVVSEAEERVESVVHSVDGEHDTGMETGSSSEG
eukprot:augustus_masked-scaffold_1-processed-gene-23.1-mRNA-1 protein AED:1.00 eAED:1.00 QI:0/-1/0/0/-1/1/1/0/511